MSVARVRLWGIFGFTAEQVGCVAGNCRPGTRRMENLLADTGARQGDGAFRAIWKIFGDARPGFDVGARRMTPLIAGAAQMPGQHA